MKRIVVLGGAESGVGSAVLAKVKGFDVFLSDMGTIKPHYQDLLNQYHIDFEQGHHTPERILNADEIIKSPGIPATAPLVAEAIGRGIPIISEIEFAGRYSRARMICITGSNGKTTTTMLTQHILATAGLDATFAGNIGQSLALQVAQGDHDYYVVELSSFQLDNMYDFRADIAVLLNITPDHLDRYDHKMDNYIAAKLRIMQNQRPDDTFIYWADDPILAARVPEIGSPATMLPFTSQSAAGCAANVDNSGVMTIAAPGCPAWTMPAAELPIKGLHNLYNAMAASLAA